MLIQLLFLLSNILYTRRYGNNSGTCSKNNPCSYTQAKNLCQKEDYVHFIGKNVLSDLHLNELKNLVENCVLKGSRINGGNMLINGSFSYVHTGFFIFDQLESVEITNFNFIEFHIPIFIFREVKNTNISNNSFIDCKIDRKLSLISISNQITTIEHCIFLRNLIHESSLVIIHSSTISFRSTIFRNNFVDHLSSQSLILLFNSNLTIKESNISDNHVPISPIITLDHNSNCLLQSSLVSSNSMSEMIFCESYSNTTFINSTFKDNLGKIYFSETSSSLIIKNSDIIENDSHNSSLFNMFENSCGIIENSVFNNNFCHSLIMISEYSTLSLISNQFLKNSGDDSLISISSYSNCYIKDIFFNDNAPLNSIIHSLHSNMTILRTHFMKSWSPSIYSEKSSVLIDSSKFEESYAQHEISIYSFYSNVSIENSTFSDTSYYGIIKSINETINLKNNIFEGEQNMVLPFNLRKKCINCKFGINHDQKQIKDTKSLYIMFLLILILLFQFRRQIRMFWLFFQRNKENFE